MNQGRAVGFGTIWRLYSPTWKHTVWTRWYAVDVSGAVNEIPTHNLSPEYRKERSLAAATFWDIKQAIFQSRLSQTPILQASYARYLCRNMGHPARIRAFHYRVEIPKLGSGSEDGESFSRIQPVVRRLGEWDCAEQR